MSPETARTSSVPRWYVRSYISWPLAGSGCFSTFLQDCAFVRRFQGMEEWLFVFGIVSEGEKPWVLLSLILVRRRPN